MVTSIFATKLLTLSQFVLVFIGKYLETYENRVFQVPVNEEGEYSYYIFKWGI